MKALITVFALFLSSQAVAQESSGEKKRDKTKVISFEDQLVEGETKAPDLFYLLEKKQFNYKRLIKLRTNFIPEMTATGEDLEGIEATD